MFNTMTMWLNIIHPDAPSIIHHLNERLGIIRANSPERFPNLRPAETIFSVSDYSNDDSKDSHQVITFFICDWTGSIYSNILRSNFRQQTVGYEREFQFKKLNKDRERLRLLEQYLETFDSVNGVVFSVLIHKSIRYLFGKPVHQVLKTEGLGNWKPHIAEKLLRIIHLQALFVYGLSRQGQKYLWMTDRDAITTNLKALGDITQRVFNIYAHHGFSPLGYAEPLGTLRDPFRDYLAIPDLVGGATLELMRNQNLDYDRDIEDKTMVQQKTFKILKWLISKSKKVKHIGCRIYGDAAVPSVSFFDLHPQDIKSTP